MAQPAAVLRVLVTANTKGATTGLLRLNSTLAATDARAKGTQGQMAMLAKTAGKAGLAGGLLALGVGAKKAFGEFREAQKVTKQTEAVLKSTGNQAKVTAKEIANLAQKISLKAGIDDEAIQSGQNLLLTFTKIRNETGKGNEIFNEATRVITDMSVALDQDLKSSAIQVGKALQDPEKGITALKRVGVNFTETQREMITKWLEHGKVLKAQKFILAELNREFKGSAAAQADGADKLRVAWENMFEELGKVIGPTINKAMESLARFLNQMRKGTGAGGRFADQLRDVGEVIKDLWPLLRTTIQIMAAYAGVTKTVAGVRIPGFIQVLLKLANPVLRTIELIKLVSAAVRALARFFTSVAQTGRRLAGTVGDVLAPAFKVLKDVVNVALTPLRKVYGILKDIVGIAGKVAGVLGDVGGVVKHIPGIGDPKGWREKMQALVQSNLGQMPGGTFHGGTWKWANQIAGRFGLHTSSSYRSPSHNAAVGGVPNSLHTHGSPKNPGAIDMVGPVSQMNAAASWARSHIPGIQEVLVHDAGSGLHLHLGFFAKGGKVQQSGLQVVGERGPEIVSMPVGTEVFSHSKSRAMAASMGGMLPGFASGGMVRAATAGRAAGFKGSALQYLLAIGAAESGNYTNMVGDQSMGGSYGPWQIHHPSHPQYNTSRLQSDWTYAAKAAYAISGGGSNWGPWTMFRNGGYRPYMGQAASVISASKGKGPSAVKRMANIVGKNGKSTTVKGTRSHSPYGGLGRGGILEAFITAQSDRLNMAQALAALTEDTQDDIAVAHDAVKTWTTWLGIAQLNNLPAGITTTATNLKSARDTLADLTAAPGPSSNDVERAGLLQTLLSQANLRTAVSQAQYGALRYGGQFQDGGVVPGAIGSPRVIVAHGGETVSPVGAGGVQVIVNGDIINTPRGKKAVEVRDIRGHHRALPGRGGG